VKALEERAPGASTKDLSELQGGKIFSAFNNREREMIYERLKMIDGLVPSLFTFFRDIQYLKRCIDCLERLVIVPKRESVCETLARTYSDENQREGHVKIQISEDSFLDQAATPAECVDLGVRQLIALAMRDYPAMPADPIKEDPVQTAPTKADPAVLRRLADLAFELGFDTPQIRALKEYPILRTARRESSSSPPLHVTSGRGVAMPARSGIPRTKAYEEDRDSLFITHLHSEQQDRGEGITSFFVRKSVYLAFFGRPISTNSGNDGSRRGSSPNDSHVERPDGGDSSGSPEHMEDIDDILSTYAQRGEDDPAQTSADTVEDADDTLDRSGEREWASARARERARERDREREEREREEREREEREREEREREEREREEREREERETEKRERERRERERLAQAEAERRQVQARLERERLVQKLEEERRRHEEQRLEEERRRQEEQRLEEERLEEERRRQEEQRQEEERLEEERRRQEEQRQEEERQEEERLEEERLEEERRRLEEQRQEEERLEEERRRQEEQRLEEERRRLEEQRLEQGTICINFFIRERDSWRHLSPIRVNPGEPSEITRIAKKYLRKGVRTFNTRLKLLPPQDCFQAVFEDRTHTVLLIPDGFGIDEEIVESTRKLHADARKRVLGLKRIATDDISQSRHVRKRQALNP